MVDNNVCYHVENLQYAGRDPEKVYCLGSETVILRTLFSTNKWTPEAEKNWPAGTLPELSRKKKKYSETAGGLRSQGSFIPHKMAIFGIFDGV